MRPALAPSWLPGLCLVLAACGPSRAVGVADAPAPEAACVKAAVELPWPASSHPGLEVVAGNDAIAVLNRQADRLDMRTYGLDGAFLATASFPADAQVLGAPGDGFIVVERTDDGADLVEAIVDAKLTAGTAEFAIEATGTERALAALALPATTILVTDERFINLATGRSATWAVALDEAAAQTFKDGRVYGLAEEGGKILLAWGAHSSLGLAALDTSAHVVTQAMDGEFFAYLGAETASAMAVAGGLLLFDGNPVRTTEIDFALTRHALPPNQELETFYRTVPRVAGVLLDGQPVAFWLSVYPSTDNSQGSAPHQLYGCALDLAAPKACAAISLVATTDLGGYEIASEPVAAAALPGGDAAIVHTDVDDRTWLRIADLSCR